MIFNMKEINLKTEIKIALAKNSMTQQGLVQKLQKEYNVKITESGLSQKLTNETLRFSELKLICKILNHEIELKEK